MSQKLFIPLPWEKPAQNWSNPWDLDPQQFFSCGIFAGTLDFSGMSRIKLKTEEMEAQVSFHGRFRKNILDDRFDDITMNA